MGTFGGSIDLPPSLRDRVECRIAEFLDGPPPAPGSVDVRRAVARAHVLPLYLDWTACLAISPEGRLVWLFYEEPYEVETVHEERLLNLALCQGSNRYPELRPLIPSRPPDARECPTCKGTGRLSFPKGHERLADRVVCECGGLGWLPGRPRSKPWWKLWR